MGPRAIVLDFGDKIDSAQPLIYRRMITFKKSGLRQLREGYWVYENKKYGIRLEYPSHWIEDEFDEDDEDYFGVVQFRETVENKPPFVTIYINRLQDGGKSLEAFVENELKELKNDSMGVEKIQFRDRELGGKPARELLFFENIGKGDPDKVYKQMIVWANIDSKVYELSYSARYHQFMNYWATVEKMIDSFQFINTEEVAPDLPTEQGKESSEAPLLILKRRFALGEITEEEYQRMKKILES